MLQGKMGINHTLDRLKSATRIKAFFTLVCLPCVAVSAASRLVNVVLMFFAVAAVDHQGKYTYIHMYE
ncbi:hypothetical protein CsatA_020418 [Cannabis sativa]